MRIVRKEDKNGRTIIIIDAKEIADFIVPYHRRIPQYILKKVAKIGAMTHFFLGFTGDRTYEKRYCIDDFEILVRARPDREDATTVYELKTTTEKSLSEAILRGFLQLLFYADVTGKEPELWIFDRNERLLMKYKIGLAEEERRKLIEEVLEFLVRIIKEIDKMRDKLLLRIRTVITEKERRSLEIPNV